MNHSASARTCNTGARVLLYRFFPVPSWVGYLGRRAIRAARMLSPESTAKQCSDNL
jgi:hypothetical protein